MRANPIDPAPLRVAVIVGSTREGRVGPSIAGWLTERAARRTDVDPSVVDLVDFAFPARLPGTPTPAMTAFTARIAAADAFVVVTPEYNRSFPASLKQAIDYGYDEWRAKPVGFVAYGCRSGGLFAVEQLRGVFTELHTVTMRDAVCLHLLDGTVDDRCRPRDGGDVHRSVIAMLDQLVWWGRALRAARAIHPYVS
ncbi:NAD(P)H-dependent FMN reductase [Amycolatopsis arida]|uniref:NAD(P)H-dependent FMN reductase n=1 Tax=Amycolatopsis arida TaxID=587909 RepID=A0A1I6AJP2_9PSEU|nr:NAD(P)H-dependent oxidoreductase [Amycolatopsis arida]TDX87325.1 NAD(P)H-dependent FMN reductase [Amycolatopsis arida]SFQ68863.1 NAD(P)H-dependent FMN reductase [Amycolatopsis arida]